MRIEDFDYNLPEELIAQYPTKERDRCRLMVLNRNNGTVSHEMFYQILDHLHTGDCMVFNSSKVLPARIFGKKMGTGVPVEFLLTKRVEGREGEEDIWETMVRPGRRLKPGDKVVFGTSDDANLDSKFDNHANIDSEQAHVESEHAYVESGQVEANAATEVPSVTPASPHSHKGKLTAEILEYGEGGTRIVRFEYDGIFMEVLDEIGRMPLPPYIDRKSEESDKEMYQTVYADQLGSVASPTAGLHFTEELLKEIEEKGVKLEFVTLHVGIGTFRPVKVDNIEDHQMHFEEYSVSEETAASINESILLGNRIISVGTTSTRTLESAAYFDEKTGKYLIKSGSGSTGIFIYPGYKFKVVNALITNFHLPKSTLLMLISALYDREKILEAYRIAVEERYRFFSYGDAMLIE